MKTKLLPILLIAITFGCSSSKETVMAPAPSIYEFSNTINADGLRADLSVLAHDSLQGRDTGTEGLRKAARYLAGRYKMLGLEAVSDDGSYFQYFDLSQTITHSNTYKVYDTDGNLWDESVHNADNIASFSTLIAGNQQAEGSITFAGYGVDNEATGVNHFPDDVAGKWLMVFYDRAITNFSAIQSRIGEGKAVGALLIMGADTAGFVAQAERIQGEFGSPDGMSLSYLQDDSEFNASVNRVHPEMAVKLLGLSSLEELASMDNKMKENLDSFTPTAIEASLEYVPDMEHVTIQSKNVVAYIEGSDPELKNEVVVLSSHYDHVGIGTPDSTGDSIYNGADDDGSGTVGLLHSAQAMMAAKQAGAGPKRSVLFLHVSGEEKGLLGSRYYSDHPIFEIENTVANLNADMIGRRDYEHPDDPDYIYVIGGKIISSGLQEMMEQANEMSVNIKLSDRYNDLNDPNQFYRRSDHWNFGRLGIPFVFFFNGVHDQYHRPGDEIELIDFPALTKRSQLLYMTTAVIANSAERPVVDNQEFIERTRQ